MKTALPIINLVSMTHLIFLCLWGGVVATESVLELLPYRRRDLHPKTIEYHFWIDLLVELPLVLLVIASGVALALLAWPLRAAHFLKIGCALVAVSANLVCIALVISRRGQMTAGASEETLWRVTRRVVLCAVIGLPFSAVAAGLGFFLAYHRLLILLSH
jgi:hypothetical protein